MLGVEELDKILEEINHIVIRANRTGDLDDILKKIGLDISSLMCNSYATIKEGKIVVIGASEVKERHLLGVIKDLGINKERFEFNLDYNRAKMYEFRKLRYNPDYRLIVLGPIPHSTVDKHNFCSIISEMKNSEGYPRIEVLSSNSALKITKTNFENKLRELLKEDYI